MTLELVKYPYGKVVRYTAFCLTPKLKEAKTIVMGGNSFKVTNKGPSSRAAKHFETPQAVLGYLRSSGHKLLNLGTRTRQEGPLGGKCD